LGYNLYLVKRNGRAASDQFSREEWDRLRATPEIPDWVYFETAPSPSRADRRAGCARS
jgi:hypothetical protein